MKLKWPDRDREIIVQQDGASLHVDQDDPELTAAAMAGNWQMSLLTQWPAQSPDTNALDLSFFRSLQLVQWDHGHAAEKDGLIVQVIRACVEFCPRNVDFGFLTLQSCLDETLVSNGNNTCKIWGRRDFLERALCQFALLQALKHSSLQGRLLTTMTTKTLLLTMLATHASKALLTHWRHMQVNALLS
jgi:hypothetical protein